MEGVPFSNLLLGLNSYPECGFLVKNEGSSRKRITFAHRQRDVLLFELLSSDLFLAKLKGKTDELSEDSYWTLMDAFGIIQEIPPEMKQILERSNWT